MYECALDSSQMPPLSPFTFTTDYRPSDIAAILQGAAFNGFGASPLFCSATIPARTISSTAR
jgi:hypothetical protein